MAEFNRVTQVGIEFLQPQAHEGPAVLRATQVGIEFLVPYNEAGAVLRHTQVGIEFLVPLNIIPDVISAAQIAAGTIQLTRTAPGSGGDVLTIERNQGAGWAQISGELDPDTVTDYYDEGFDTFGSDPQYRTRLSAAAGPTSYVSEPVTVDLSAIVGPDAPTLTIVQIDSIDAITDNSVQLESGDYSDSLARDMAGVDWEIRRPSGAIVVSERVLVDPADGDVWQQKLIEGLSDPGDSLIARVRHLALGVDDSLVPGAWSADVPFDLLGEVPVEVAPESPATVGSSTYKSEYPYGTFGALLACPNFDQGETECPGDAQYWYGKAWLIPNGTSIIGWPNPPADLNADYTFARGGTRPGVNLSWIYRCYTPTPGGFRWYTTFAKATVEIQFCPDTPFVFEESNISAGQIVATNSYAFRWWENGYMMCAGASVNQSFSGGVRDPAYRAANSTLLYDGILLDIRRLTNFGGTWTIDAVQNGIVYPLGTHPFGHRDYISTAGGDDWLARGYYDVWELGEVDEVGWEKSLNLSSVPDGITQIRVSLDGRVARLTHPFILDRVTDTLSRRYAGMDLRVAGLSLGGSEGAAARWADREDGGVQYTGLAGDRSHAALQLVGTPRNFSMVIEGAWATREEVTSDWAFMFTVNRLAYFGAAGYVRDQGGYSSLQAMAGGGGSANGYNRTVNQGEGAAGGSWWWNGPRHGRGVARFGIRKVGPAAPDPASVVSIDDRSLTRWDQSGVGYGTAVSSPLRPKYSVLLKVEDLGLGGVRLSGKVHGPDSDTGSEYDFSEVVPGIWASGVPALMAYSGDGATGSVVAFYSASVYLPPPPPPPAVPVPSNDCALEVTKYAEDRETEEWMVSDSPGWGEGYLIQPRHYGEQVIDLAKGTAKLAQLSVQVIDPWVGDQRLGIMTARLADYLGISAIQGYRLRVRRWAAQQWVTLADGPGGAPSQDTYSSFLLPIRDSREWERKLQAFVTTDTIGAFPRGVTNGFGAYGEGQYLVSPTAPGLAEWQNSTGIGEGHGILTKDTAGDIFWDEGNEIPANIVYVDAIADLFTGVFDSTLYPPNGGWRYPLVFHWRAAGSSDPWVDMPDITVDEHFFGPMFVSYVRPNVPIIAKDAVLEDGTEVQGVASIRLDWSDPAILALQPEPGADIEFYFSTANPVPVSENFPYHIEGITLGQFLKNLYDGVYSPRDDNDALIPSGVRYNEADLLALTEPVIARITEPVDDVREWAEANGYAATGRAPAFNHDMEISPVSDVIPTDSAALAALTVIENAICVPEPSWAHGSKIVNLLSYTYPRWYPHVSSEAIDGLLATTVTIQRRSAESIWRNGRQELEITTELFGSIASNKVTPLTVDFAESLAEDRRVNLFNRLKFGAPTFQLSVFRIATYHLRTGDFVRVVISWMPDYATRTRDMDVIAQILGIADLDCNLRRLTLEVCGPFPAS